jgi:16S rRNA (uracil1498-N3)-methyltransferase
MARVWRVFASDLPQEAGARITLSADESHHVRRVLRLGPGERVGVFDGNGNEWLGRIAAGSSPDVHVELVERRTAEIEAPLRLCLFQGDCAPDRMELVVQKATELGVAEVRTIAGHRARRPAAEARKLERLRRIALEACKQCGRRVLPRIDRAEELPGAVAGVPAWLLDPAAPPLARLALAGGPPREAWLAVGPEGGFTDEEIARAEARGWRPAGLGPRILRTETAGLVAVSILMHRFGDLGSDAARGRVV